MGSIGGLGGVEVEEEPGATCCETPSASQPVFCGSSPQDTPTCQEVPWEMTKPRDTETLSKILV